MLDSRLPRTTLRTADGKTLLANLRNWEGSSGLLAWDVEKLIATASNPAQAQELGREGLYTVNPNALSSFKSFGWVYGVDTQADDLNSRIEINANLGDLSGSALGRTITLDTDPAGHGWFLDTTPWANEEFFATSSPKSNSTTASS